MNDPIGRFRFKYVGRPNGILIKGAPSNYRQNEIYELPYAYIRRPGFELLDPPPVLKVPPAQAEDSVFEDQAFIPPNLDEDEPEKFDSIPVNLTMEVKEVLDIPIIADSTMKDDEVKLVNPATFESLTITSLEPPAEPAGGGGVEELVKSVKLKKAEGLKPADVGGGFPPLPPKREVSPFEVEATPGDDMPPELRYELETLGDGVLGEGGEEKVVRKRKKAEE